jgi:hypothetical protein
MPPFLFSEAEAAITAQPLRYFTLPTFGRSASSYAQRSA